MDEQKIAGIRKGMAEKPTEELLEIIHPKNRDEWTEEALAAAKQVLADRDELPPVRNDPADRATESRIQGPRQGMNGHGELFFNADELCWWCGKTYAGKESSMPIPMWRDVKKKCVGKVMNLKEYQYSWEALTVVVPRCPDCEGIHDIYEHYGRINRWAAGIGIAALFAGLLAMAFDNSPALEFIRGGFVFLTLGIMMAIYLVNETRSSKLVKGVRRATYKLHYPEVVKRRKERWQFGDKPPLDSPYIREKP